MIGLSSVFVDQTCWSSTLHPPSFPLPWPLISYQGLWLVSLVPTHAWQESALRELMSCHSLPDVPNLPSQEGRRDLLARGRNTPSPQSDPATTAANAATHPSDAMTPTSTAEPSITFSTLTTTTTHAHDAAPPPYTTARSSDPPISLNRHYGNLLLVRDGLQRAVDILAQELHNMVLELAKERERNATLRSEG
jgi:hypothetical protein